MYWHVTMSSAMLGVFTCPISCIPHSPVRLVLLLTPRYRWGQWGQGRFGTLFSYIAVGTELSPRHSDIMDCDFNNFTELVCACAYMHMCVWISLLYTNTLSSPLPTCVLFVCCLFSSSASTLLFSSEIRIFLSHSLPQNVWMDSWMDRWIKNPSLALRSMINTALASLPSMSFFKE